MITQTFPSLHPQSTFPLPWQGGQKKVYQLPAINGPRPTPRDVSFATKFKITPEEYVRRDNCVKNLWVSNPYKVGDMAYPQHTADSAKYGLMTIRGVFQSYADFPLKEAMEWPDDDTPHILTCSSAKQTGLVLCTANWLQKKHHKPDDQTT